MVSIIKVSFFVSTFLLPLCISLNILTVLPCYGGHFGAMTSIIQLLSRDNHVTVVSTSSNCDKKLVPIQKRASFDLIQGNMIIGEAAIESEFHFLMIVGDSYINMAKNMSLYFDNFLARNRDNFDVIIADVTNLGVFLSAESFNMPIIVSSPGISLGSEHSDEMLGMKFYEMLAWMFAFDVFTRYIDSSRRERGLPEVISQNNLLPFEHFVRFPSILFASPSFYPKPHESVESIFIGGYRNETDSEMLSEDLTNWLNLDSSDVIYVSMGTHTSLQGRTIQEFAEGVRNQNRYRVIWSLSVGMQATVNNLGLTSDSSLYFSKYLPQYTLLGHEKVKVFVTHGGLLSSIDVIKRKKPSVCVPYFGDQFYNCRVMEGWGTSKQVLKFTFSGINQEILEILGNYDSYLSKAVFYGDDLTKYEDVKQLNEYVNKVAARRKTTLIKEFQYQLYSDRAIRLWFIFKIAALCVVVAILVLVFCGMRRLIGNKGDKFKPKKN